MFLSLRDSFLVTCIPRGQRQAWLSENRWTLNKTVSSLSLFDKEIKLFFHQARMSASVGRDCLHKTRKSCLRKSCLLVYSGALHHEYHSTCLECFFLSTKCVRPSTICFSEQKASKAILFDVLALKQ